MALTLLGRLEQSILARAFRGELMPQEPIGAEAPEQPAFERPALSRPRVKATA